MKGLLVLFALVAVCLSYPVAEEDTVLMARYETADHFVEFLKGFLEGINEKGDINKLLSCIKNGEEIINKIKQAIEILKKINLENLIKGITLLLDAVKQLLDSLKPCMEGFDQLKRLMNAVMHADIKKIAMRILMHPGEFVTAITQAINCFSKNDLHCAGKAIGDILRMLFLDRLQADPARDFIKGFLEGIHETKKVEDLDKCLKDLEPILEKIKKALEFFMKMTFDDLLKGFKLMMEAMKDLEAMLKPCLEGFTQIKKLMEAIQKADFVKIIMKIIMNPGAFIKDVTDCIEALKKLDMYTAGKAMGDILFRLFLSRSTAPNPIQVFLKGFLVGIHEVKTIDDLIKCMKNADQILEKIKTALLLIRKFTIESLFAGFSMLFEALFELETMLRPCLGEFTQFKKLIEAIMNADMDDLIEKVIKNAFQFIADIIDCVRAFENGDYEKAGKDIGDILYRLFLVEENLQGFDPVAFIKGFLEGINEKGDINELLKCVKNLEQIVNKIIQAIQLIQKMDIGNLIKGITLLVEAVTELLNVLKPCANGFEQIKKLIDAIGHIDIMKLIFKILANPGPFIQDVVTAIDAFKHERWQEGGKSIGDLLYRLFLASLENVEFVFEDAIKLIEGFIKGSNQEKNFEKIGECIKTIPHVYEDVKKIIEMIKEVDWKDIEKMISIFFKAFDAVKRILAALKPCSNAPEEVEKIIKKIMELTLEKILDRVMKNTFAIIYDVVRALDALKLAEYKDFGINLGDIFYIIVIKA